MAFTNQFNIYTASDPNGPGLLLGVTGSLISLLNACLVNGYTGKSAAGWTKPLPDSGSVYAMYTQGTGSGFSLFINDWPQSGAGGQEAWATGWETMSVVGPGPGQSGSIAVGAGTGQFPTTTQGLTNGHVTWRKSANTTTGRWWILMADSATMYLWIQTGDNGTNYFHVGFGDCYSLAGAQDLWNCFIYGRNGDNTNQFASNQFDYTDQIGAGPYQNAITQLLNALPCHFVARSGFGNGASLPIVRRGDEGVSAFGMNQSFSPGTISGVMQSPMGGDGCFYISPIWLVEAGSLTPIRGRFRGMYQLGHPIGNFSDGQIISGSNDYAGKTFMCIKPSANNSLFLMEVSPTLEFN